MVVLYAYPDKELEVFVLLFQRQWHPDTPYSKGLLAVVTFLHASMVLVPVLSRRQNPDRSQDHLVFCMIEVKAPLELSTYQEYQQAYSEVVVVFVYRQN